MTDFLNMTPEQLEKDFMASAGASTIAEPDKENEKEKPADSGAQGEEETKPSTQTPGDDDDTFKTSSEFAAPIAQDTADNSDTKPLDLEEVKNVSADAFKDAYDHFKKNAVGDPKTREKYLGQLRDELAEYQEGEDGTKTVTRGILKNFTDTNYQNALKAGESVINSTISQLSSTKYPSFEAFKAAREKAAASVHAQLQKNVAYPELSESFLKSLEDLSTKKGLEFNLSKNEREKENVIMAQSRKNVEQQKKSQEFEESTMNSQQVQKNLDTERRLLQEQNEKQEREWKSRIDLEAQLRQQQIAADLKSGFEERAKSLHEEMNASNQQQMMMMMQMQKESKEQQDKLTQLLTMEMNKQPPPPPPRPAGLLSTILAPVANFLGKLL